MLKALGELWSETIKNFEMKLVEKLDTMMLSEFSDKKLEKELKYKINNKDPLPIKFSIRIQNPYSIDIIHFEKLMCKTQSFKNAKISSEVNKLNLSYRVYDQNTFGNSYLQYVLYFSYK